MGIFSRLKKMTGFDNNNQETQDLKKCRVEVKMKKAEFIMLSKFYYRGHTSYKSIYKYVYLRNVKKILDIMDMAKKKANEGCDIDFTYIKFFYNQTHYIEIPFEVFSNKRNMTINLRNSKRWNELNIRRILKLYPDFIEYEKTLISESDIINLIDCK
jgi:hypothetical protein